jgi:hypothetical protein
VADARPAASFARFDGNDVLVIHDKEFSIIPGSVQLGFVRYSVIAGIGGPTTGRRRPARSNRIGERNAKLP